MKRSFLFATMISFILISCSKEEGEGGRSSISGILEGVISTSARAEITEVTCVPEDDIKKADYWLLNTPDSNDNYFVWYNDVSDATTPPSFASRVGIQVDYSSVAADNNITIAINTESAINSVTGAPFTVVRDNDKLTITNTILGSVTDADNGISDFIVDVETQGRNEVILQNGVIANEDIFIIYGDGDDIHDDDIKSNFDGTFKFDNLRKGSYRVFAYSEDASLTNPLTPILKSIEIGSNEDANIGTLSISKKDD